VIWPGQSLSNPRRDPEPASVTELTARTGLK
jgi:hypothetical protein